MAELHDLSPPEGSTRKRKRVGRGEGSGLGKTSGRGQKGQKARSGGQIPPGFEGGQMPLHRRVPKRGFTPLKRTVYQVVNVGDLARVEGTTVTPETLLDAGLVSSTRGPVKILGTGEVETAYTVEAHAFSGTAEEKITAAGGSATVIRKKMVKKVVSQDGDAAEAAAEDAPGASTDEEE